MATALLALLATAGHGNTRLVPTSYPTIQQGIFASTAGDTVLVLPGTYVENILIDRDVAVKSAEGPAVTVIDGGSPPDPFLGSVVRMSAGSIEGFDICNGRGSFPGPANGWRGGGILVTEGEAPGVLIQNNWIHDNRVVAQSGVAEGGGIAILQTAVARVISNRIFDNRLENTSMSGGAEGTAIRDRGLLPETRIDRNEIFDNSGMIPNWNESFRFFGAIVCGEGTVSGNLVACNMAAEAPGIYGTGVVEGNTVVANWSLSEDSAVIVVGFLDQFARATNNNICLNVGPGLDCLSQTHTTTFIVECNNLFGNGPGGQIVGDCSGAIGQNGNISVDPEFARGACPSTHGDWCLGPESSLLPDHSPPGCGLIGALGECPPIAVPEVELPRPGVFWALDPRPNPFAVRTSIPFHLGEPAPVEITIYGVMGRKVRTLRAGYLGAGNHELVWDARDDGGRRAAAGGYVAAIRAGRDEVTRTLLLVW